MHGPVDVQGRVGGLQDQRRIALRSKRVDGEALSRGRHRLALTADDDASGVDFHRFDGAAALEHLDRRPGRFDEALGALLDRQRRPPRHGAGVLDRELVVVRASQLDDVAGPDWRRNAGLEHDRRRQAAAQQHRAVHRAGVIDDPGAVRGLLDDRVLARYQCAIRGVGGRTAHQRAIGMAADDRGLARGE